MRLNFVNLTLVLIIGSISLSFSAPIENKQNSGCGTANGAARSTVDVGTKDEDVHLLADLDALANGIKKSNVESGCDNTADKKSKDTSVHEISVGNIPGTKRQAVQIIKETSVVNEDEIGKAAIIETGKAAIRSEIVANASTKSTNNATKPGDNEINGNTSIKVEGDSAANKSEAKQASNATEVPQGAAAKTFIASKVVDVTGSKRSGSILHTGKHQPSKFVKTKNAAKKSIAAKATRKTLDAAASIEDGPSMQTGSLSKESEKEEKATAKSTSNALSPLNSAIKSLDSATKLLGMATSSISSNKDTKTATTPAKTAAVASTDKSAESSSSNAKVSGEQKAELKPSKSNATDVSSITRSAGSSSSGAKPGNSGSSDKPAKVSDPYAEIAGGPDSPKMPDLKTGSEKAGLPVMKVDPSGAPPEPVSFDKPEPGDSPKAPLSGSSNRAGPQDVGGILDQLTDRLNKGGVAPENPLPPTESREITDQLSEYDHEALDQAKGWEATGLKAIEKLKSAEYVHGNMKTELSKELTDRLGGYGAAIDGNLESAGSEVGNLDAPAQTSYSQPDYGHQHSSQWPEFNSVESLDSEAQREEQPFSQYPDEHAGNYGAGGEAMMPADQNGYDRQEIPSFYNQAIGRDSVDSTQGQDFYKRSIILKPYYYNNIPYGFRHPYED